MVNHNTLEAPEPFLSKRRLGWAGLAAFGGCALACTLPVAAVLTLGTGAATVITSFLRPGSELVVGGTAFALALGYMAVRARAKVKVGKGCEARTSSMNTCDCGPSASGSTRLFSNPAPKSDKPIVCTADLKNSFGIQAQLDAYRDAFTHLSGAEQFPGGFRWRFHAHPGLDTVLKGIAERESRCCAFLRFELRQSDNEITWEARGDDRAAPFLDEYFRLPEQLRAEPRRGHDVDALKHRVTQAGLVFAGDNACANSPA